MKVRILLLLLLNDFLLFPGLVASTDLNAGQEQQQQQQRQELEVDPTCSSVDGSCVNEDAVKEGETVAKNHGNGSKEGSVVVDDVENCEDSKEQCKGWAERGECEKNSGYMHKNCRRSCEVCSLSGTPVADRELQQGLDLGVAQQLGGRDITKNQVVQALEEARNYMSSDNLKDLPKALMDMCRNKHKECTTWALSGECDANPGFMQLNCAPMCHSCDLLSMEKRCPMNPDAPEAWGPGDLNKMFSRLTSEPYLSEYNVQIISSPFDEEGGPWLITLDNIVKKEEAERLIELGDVEGYKQSGHFKDLKPDGTVESRLSQFRTSMNAWCQNDCYEDEMAQRVIHRLSNLTGIDETNSEYLQLLRYEEGQYYKKHHDYIDIHTERQPGVRILTFYLYLNDVEEGGGTNFDQVKNVTVTPKRGRAVLWPSVLDENPSKKDGRTTHKANPVIKGVKYGANAWFHLRDFKNPLKKQCI